jgi:hypothetical protein
MYDSMLTLSLSVGVTISRVGGCMCGMHMAHEMRKYMHFTPHAISAVNHGTTALPCWLQAASCTPSRDAGCCPGPYATIRLATPSHHHL